MTQGNVLVEQGDDGVRVVTIDNLERRNALSAAVRSGLREAFEDAESDSNCQGVVLTGTGETFCSGADLKEMSETGLAIPPKNFVPTLGRNVPNTKPVIAAVNGYALGGGFLLAQQCDLAVAAENATFGMPEVRWGRGAPWSVPLMWMIPRRIWLELALTGRPIGAQRAYEVGLVNRVVPRGQALNEARNFLAEICKGAPLTVRATKRIADLATGGVSYPAWDVADAIFESVYSSRDAQEGPLSFVEKRDANWVEQQPGQSR